MTLIEQIKRDREAGTPGGWTGGDDPDGEICMDDEVGAWICCVNFDNVPDVQARADARRIARVPQLEAALLAAEELAKVTGSLIDLERPETPAMQALTAFRKACEVAG